MALLCGVLFGAGLAVSQMTNPAKVQAFLDVAGSWDPSLAFVMGAALLVSAAGYQAARRRARPLLEDRFHVPPPGAVDPRLLAGSAAFGVGWGLSGFCPGPALASLVTGSSAVIVFVSAMLAGTLAVRLLRRIPPARDAAGSGAEARTH